MKEGSYVECYREGSLFRPRHPFPLCWNGAEHSDYRRNGTGFQSSGFDRDISAPIRVGLTWAGRSAVLSRGVGTILPPPVGGLSRSSRSHFGGRRKCNRSLSRYGCPIRTFAHSTLAAISHFVRRGTARHQGMESVECTRERRNREARRVCYRSR